MTQVEEAFGATSITLDAKEIVRLEMLGDQTKGNTLREWEKEIT